MPEAAPAPSATGAGPGLSLVRYRALFSGPAVERVEPLAFQRPSPEVELSPADAQSQGLATGDLVSVKSNGTARELTARVNRRLRPGVVRIADGHARGLEDTVEIARAS